MEKINNNEDHNEIYDKFWKEIVEVGGVIDIEQVKKELADYWFILQQVPKVYGAITKGKLTKPNYYASEVIAEYEDCVNKLVEEELKEQELKLRTDWLAYEVNNKEFDKIKAREFVEQEYEIEKLKKSLPISNGWKDWDI